MPKRRSRWLEGPEEEESGNIETIVIPEPEFRYVRVVSALDANLKIKAPYSGREYVFEGAGSVADVDERDVEYLLSKRQGKQCCGGGEGAQILYLVEE